MFPMDSGSPRDIKLMGVHMLTLANNHSGDYGTEALAENMRLIRAAGLAYVGAGNNLREARAATLVTTPKGRVTVVAAAGTFKDGFSAVDGRRGGDPEKPGISVVRTTTIQLVTAREMALLQQLNALRQPAGATPDTALPQRLTVLGQTYLLSDAPGISYQINPTDLLEIMQAVHTAKQNSDFTVFTIHAHQSATGEDDINPVPADYLVQLFHSVVDAGADVVAGHGNHLLRGIEIYKGKPIFYGVASFSFSGRSGGLGNAGRGGQPPAPAQPTTSAQPPRPPTQPSNEYLRPLPGGGEPLSMWECIFATTEWAGGKLKEIRIYPIDLSAAGDKPKGPSAFASPALAKKILEEMRRISAPFGTNVQIEGEVGIIRP
jgi:poly-gamma-glutamate synthesis protein (capsule biosynthesis protein)